MRPSEDDLGRLIFWCAAACQCTLALSCVRAREDFRAAKVGEDDVTIRVDQYIFRFDVAVNNPGSVQDGKSLDLPNPVLLSDIEAGTKGAY